MLQQNGHAIRPQLLYKLTQARVPDSEKQAVQNGAWGWRTIWPETDWMKCTKREKIEN